MPFLCLSIQINLHLFKMSAFGASATCDFLLLFRSNYCGTVTYRFQAEGQYLPTFPIPIRLMLPLGGFPLKFCDCVRAQKTRIMPLRDR